MMQITMLALDAEFEPLLNRFSREAEEDYVGFWQIVDAVKDSPGLAGLTGEALPSAVSEFVRRMLQHGFVAVDLTYDGGCSPWINQSPAAIVERIEQDWAKLGREPTIGELAWFDKSSTNEAKSYS